jgi:transglutaminase-like putative cysteine protease
VTLQKVSPQVLPIALARIQLPDWYYQTTENYTGFLHSFRVGTGPVLLSNEPVMRVQCERGLLWRGAVYDKYTGRAWEQTDLRNGWASLVGPPGYFTIDVNKASLKGLAPRPQVAQRILAEKQMPSVLFGAAEPVRVEGRMMRVVQTGYGGISAPRMVFKGSQYVVYSDIPDVFTPAQLQSAGTVYPPEIESVYRSELPFGTERIRELTQKVIADAATPYDRARAIQEYLEQNYIYGDVERVPAGEDVASYFLFRTQQGVCDMFATAMVLMSREAGIPARLVTGFAAGQFNPERQEYLVTHKEAHAWAELYFPGYGWIPFDPQARRTAGLMTTLESLFESSGSVFRLLSERHLFPLTLAGLTLALIYYALRPAWCRRTKPLAPQDHRGHVVRLYHQMGAFLRRRGYPRQPGQTPREYLTHLARTAPLEPALSRSLEDLTTIFHAARYSRAPITAADHQQARALVMALRRQVRSWRR